MPGQLCFVLMPFGQKSDADGTVIDFDAVIRDPSQPAKFLPAFNSGDNLHPNDAGYKAMGEAVDLGLFK